MLTINTIERNKLGKRNSRKLRRNNKIPAVLYKNKENPIHITLIHDEIINKKNKKDFFEPLNLIVNNKKIKAKIKEIQYHPFKPKLIHIDFIIIN
ncbi:50S ribosomal protein L25 [Candidatus Providencia siddallii]|uniref:Large ribosomal subunit protein bL25 n=1 Tax=Candidatus Providencia siddallii TaxID=1715285 RepID=A0A0M6W9F0_9GAMM|nr:50S ribosomal protein L25 [Candidatus Providencia siddallii]